MAVTEVYASKLLPLWNVQQFAAHHLAVSKNFSLFVK